MGLDPSNPNFGDPLGMLGGGGVGGLGGMSLSDVFGSSNSNNGRNNAINPMQYAQAQQSLGMGGAYGYGNYLSSQFFGYPGTLGNAVSSGNQGWQNYGSDMRQEDYANFQAQNAALTQQRAYNQQMALARMSNANIQQQLNMQNNYQNGLLSVMDPNYQAGNQMGEIMPAPGGEMIRTVDGNGNPAWARIQATGDPNGINLSNPNSYYLAGYVPINSSPGSTQVQGATNASATSPTGMAGANMPATTTNTGVMAGTYNGYYPNQSNYPVSNPYEGMGNATTNSLSNGLYSNLSQAAATNPVSPMQFTQAGQGIGPYANTLGLNTNSNQIWGPDQQGAMLNRYGSNVDNVVNSAMGIASRNPSLAGQILALAGASADRGITANNRLGQQLGSTFDFRSQQAASQRWNQALQFMQSALGYGLNSNLNQFGQQSQELTGLNSMIA
jgi:hypothetical protein